MCLLRGKHNTHVVSTNTGKGSRRTQSQLSVLASWSSSHLAHIRTQPAPPWGPWVPSGQQAHVSNKDLWGQLVSQLFIPSWGSLLGVRNGVDRGKNAALAPLKCAELQQMKSNCWSQLSREKTTASPRKWRAL